MVHHLWMIEALKMVVIVDNSLNLFENSTETWRKKLIAFAESLRKVDIRRGIIQGDPFLPF